MAHIKYTLPVLDGYGAGDLLIVADPTTEWGLKTAQLFGGTYLGGSLQAAHDAAVTGKLTTVLIGPGTYTLTAALAITKTDIRFKAAVVNPLNPTVIITSSLASTVTVDSNNVTFEGIEFKAGADACTQLIKVADTTASAGLIVRNCVFNPNGKASVKGIDFSDATIIASRVLIEDNKFLTGFDAACIAVGVQGLGNSVIRRNTFQVTAAKSGITLADTSAFATGYGFEIVDNYFIGADAAADEVGITIAGTEDTTGVGVIARNIGVYTAAALVTIDKISKSEVQNYYGDAATGGTLVDPGT